MKKLTKLFGMILAPLALVFAGCSNGDDSGDTPAIAFNVPIDSEFNDCTSIVAGYSISDGNWNIKTEISSTDYKSVTDMSVNVANRICTCTSARQSMTIFLTPSNASAISTLNEEEKEEFERQCFEGSYPESVTVDDVTFTMIGNKVTATYDLPASEFPEPETVESFTPTPPGAAIKANSDRSKYVVIYAEPGTTFICYLKKL